MLAVSFPERVGFALRVAFVLSIGDTARVCTVGGAKVVKVPRSENEEYAVPPMVTVAK
jgi:hypothetical protein